ncbi:lipase member H-B-like isoform X2 [Nomia melanderi]|uniref:lipase member H-B-like isoform X2 n=1 Tax=Nomia melanderi TaxID=2448451 RepID=UPI0013046BF8|nr:lipase member H-A-like isoform X2 [Nomia melanderi]
MASNQLFIFVFVCSCLLGSAVHSLFVDVKLRLYSKDLSYVEVKAKDAALLVPKLNLSTKTIIHCHGYTQSADDSAVMDLIHNYLAGFDYNIIAADYREVTSNDYLSAVVLLDKVSDIIAQSVDTFIASGVNPKLIILSGLSLGGQVAGQIGRKTKTKIEEIIAMDPAGPLYQYVGQSVSATDANCVKCIHTDAGYYGTTHACGHLDFYPNGGTRQQPGCSAFSLNDLPNTCSHERAEVYIGESARNPDGFLSIKCNSWDDFKAGKCDKSVIIPMGEAAPCNVTGSFYLQTNSKSPYAKGAAGTVYSG